MIRSLPLNRVVSVSTWQGVTPVRHTSWHGVPWEGKLYDRRALGSEALPVTAVLSLGTDDPISELVAAISEATFEARIDVGTFNRLVSDHGLPARR